MNSVLKAQLSCLLRHLFSVRVNTPPLGAKDFPRCGLWYPAACGGVVHSESEDFLSHLLPPYDGGRLRRELNRTFGMGVDIVDIPPTLILPLRGGRKLFFWLNWGHINHSIYILSNENPKRQYNLDPLLPFIFSKRPSRWGICNSDTGLQTLDIRIL